MKVTFVVEELAKLIYAKIIMKFNSESRILGQILIELRLYNVARLTVQYIRIRKLVGSIMS